MTADPRAVEIIATATAQHHLDPDWSDADRHGRCVCGGWAEGEMDPGWDDHMADVSVAALEAAGWSLLPPGGHSYIERGQYIPAENRIATIGGPRTGTALAGPIPHSYVRHVIVWPDYTRPNDDWARYLGPWQPAATQEEP